MVATIDPLVQLQAELNRINQTTPTGSLNFSGDGSSAALTLPPEIQELLRLRTGVSKSALTSAGAGLTDFFGGGFDDARARAETSTFDRLSNLVNPSLERNEASVRTSLINRGLDERGEAFGDLFNAQVSEPRNRILSDLSLASVAEGRNEVTSRISNIQGLLNTQQTKPPTLQDFFAPNAVDVLGPENLKFNQNLAAQNNVTQQDQIKALQDAQQLGSLTTIGSTLITAAIGKGGLGGLLKGIGIGDGTLTGAVKGLFDAAASAGSSVVDFLAGQLGGGVEAVQGATELLQGAIPGIDTNLITAPATQQAAQSITGIPGAVDVASTGDLTGLLSGQGGGIPTSVSTFAGEFTIDSATGAALGAAAALQSAGLIGAGEATLLANAGFTAQEIASMNSLLATTSTAGTGAAVGGASLAGALAGLSLPLAGAGIIGLFTGKGPFQPRAVRTPQEAAAGNFGEAAQLLGFDPGQFNLEDPQRSQNAAFDAITAKFPEFAKFFEETGDPLKAAIMVTNRNRDQSFALPIVASGDLGRLESLLIPSQIQKIPEEQRIDLERRILEEANDPSE